MIEIELTDEQRQVLEAGHWQPFAVVGPATQRRYVLLAREPYERVRPVLEQGAGPEGPAALSGIAPGILRAQQAFWRDLPELLKDKRNHGRWVANHGDERVALAPTQVELIRECLRRGLHDDEYDRDVIEPQARPPWEPEVIEPGGQGVEDVIAPGRPSPTGDPA
jgi:hypothetical protein